MNDLIQCLYAFTVEKRMAALELDQEYKDSVSSVQRWEETLRARLDQEQREALDQLLLEMSTQKAVEGEYLFRAALRLSRELEALGQL